MTGHTPWSQIRHRGDANREQRVAAARDELETPSTLGTCRDCGDRFEYTGFVQLCDRCLMAKLWDGLENDDYVIVRRRRGGGNVRLQSNLNGTRQGTNVTLLGLDLREELEKRFSEVFGDVPS